MSDIKEICSGTGKGFGRTDSSDIASESCPLPDGPGKGFAKSSAETADLQTVEEEPDCSGAGKGFARTDDSDIASEDCLLPDGPGKGFAKRD